MTVARLVLHVLRARPAAVAALLARAAGVAATELALPWLLRLAEPPFSRA